MVKIFKDYQVRPGTYFPHKVEFHAQCEADTGVAYNWLRNRTDQFSHNLSMITEDHSCFWIEDPQIAMWFKLTFGSRRDV